MNHIKYNSDDIIGNKYGRLLVIGPEENIIDDNGKSNRFIWCLCDCGNKKLIRITSLFSKIHPTQSCGCLSKESIQKLAEKHRNGEIPIPSHTTHGLSNTKQYSTWCNMKTRCYNPNSDNYEYYGGKGIKICDEWLDKNSGFINFYNWSINNGYNDNLEIDRIDSKGNYCPENCRWVDRTFQNNNKCNNIYLEYYGFRFLASEWSKLLGLNIKLIEQRKRNGWSDYETLSTPVLKGGHDNMRNFQNNNIIKPILELDLSKLKNSNNEE